MRISSISRRAAVWGGGCLAVAVMAITVYGVSKARELKLITGAVLRQDPDRGKQLPIANAEVSLGDDLSDGVAITDSNGLFHLKLRNGVHIGEMVTLLLRHPDYRPMKVSEYLVDRLYVLRMIPANQTTDGNPEAPTILSDIRVRYATRSQNSVNAGSALKTFEVKNNGDVPCDRHGPCSPDGRWKATIGGVTLDAGENSTFHEARVSCVAGPCPFTKIEKDDFSDGGRHIGVRVRDWSDTTTFLLEAEVTHTTNSDVILQSFPAIFDRSMSFTLPASAQGPSIEASVNGEDVVFPLGPMLTLSWATCSVKVGADGTKLYRCSLKPGYRFR
jgi:hypothetical protein